MSPGNSFTWLHLSDFHFKAKEKWEQRAVLDRLLADVIASLPDEGLQPDVVFLTGDIAQAGKKAEYVQAEKFFRELASQLGHDPQRQWFLAPGNHDVDRDLVKGLPKSARNQITEQTVGEILDEKGTWLQFAARQKEFLAFTRRFLGKDRAWKKATPWEVAHYPEGDPRVSMLCLNSAWACQDDRDETNILLGGYQMEQALKQARAQTAPIRIALFHHPFEALKDFDRRHARNKLESLDGCAFLLRGHLHEVDFGVTVTPESQSLTLAAGACWQDTKHPHAVLAVKLDLDRDIGTVHTWSYDSRREFWKRDSIFRNMSNGRWDFRLIESGGQIRPWPIRSGKQPPRVVKGPWVPALYKQRLLKAHGSMESAFLLEKGANFSLKKVYVPLTTDWFEPERRRKIEELKSKEAGKKAEPPEEAKEPTARPLGELLTLEKYRHFAIGGEPGSGKSIFTIYHAFECLHEEPNVLPLWLPLKEMGAWLAKQNGESGELLPRWAGAHYQDEDLDEKALLNRSEQGRILWLLDGLDEIFDSGLRLRAAHIIGRWFGGKRGKEDRLILTSRPHALDQKGLLAALGLEGRMAAVLPLNREAQEEFLIKWFDALYDEDTRLQGEAIRKDLWRALESQPLVADMRANPLLLTTVATIYQQGRRLPERRADLYAKAVEVLLRRRFGPMVAGGSEEQVRRLTRGLSEVAREMMVLGKVRDLSETDFLAPLSKGYFFQNAAEEANRETVRQVARDLGAHSGLLAMSGDPPRYAFPHLGFQEYLAALAFAEEKEPLARLAPHLEEGAWREVILLTAGCLFESGPSFRGKEFLEGLRDRCNQGDQKTPRLTLAVRAAAEAPPGTLSTDLTKDLRAKALHVLTQKQIAIPEKERFQLGLALGKLGDPRLGMGEDRWLWIEPGSFEMGSNKYGYDNNKPAHPVTLSHGYYLGRYPVTNAEYGEFVKSNAFKKRNISLPRYWDNERFNGPNQPVVGVSLKDALAYCRWLTETWIKEKPSWLKRKLVVRLPTEAEWEFAARRKTGRPYPWGDEESDDQHTNYDDRLGRTSPVGIYPKGATPDGLWDMSGNVWEWCLDPWDSNAYEKRKGGATDPINEGDPKYRALRALRGGAWYYQAPYLLAPVRFRYWAGVRDWNFGFRCCLAVPVEHGS